MFLTGRSTPTAYRGTGALIAIERGDRRLQALLDEAAGAGAGDPDDLAGLDPTLRLVVL